MELEKATPSGRPDAVGDEAEGGLFVDRTSEHAALCKWTIPNFSKLKQRTLWSNYATVGGFDCRLLLYRAGDSQALPGYASIYLQVSDPRSSSGKWECFASYRLSIVNQTEDTRSITRDSWHRFSQKKKSHGWCDFMPASAVLDQRSGFCINDTVVISADILVLSEASTFSREESTAGPDTLSGKFVWKVHNFSQFLDSGLLTTQKIISPVFPAGECTVRLSVYQSAVSGSDYLSMCLESKDTDKTSSSERSCWCLFRLSMHSQSQGGKHVHRDSYGRLAADSKQGDNTSLGWNDFMLLDTFKDPASGFLQDGSAVFSTSFHFIKESSVFSRHLERGLTAKNRSGKSKGSSPNDIFQGKFTWKIEHFTRLKELLKKRKITGLCIKSKRFQVGGRDCRLIVYPRGQSQPPNHLSMFLEVTDPRAPVDWSCFVSHRLSVVNQRAEPERSVSKESQNRYSKQAKDWGWREFITMTHLFDQASGFLVGDAMLFSAEVMVLRESTETRVLTALDSPEACAAEANDLALALRQPASAVANAAPAETYSTTGPQAIGDGRVLRFAWRIESFVAFKDIMETRKIFSRFFAVDGCRLRLGVYESFDTLCIYLESDALGAGPERNYWVKYRIAALNQKHYDRTDWKESSICTKSWNNSVLQLMKVSELVNQEAGHLHKDSIVLACDILECSPWFDFVDLDIYDATDLEVDSDSFTSDPDELLSSDESECGSPHQDDLFHSMLSKTGLHRPDEPPMLLDPTLLQAVLDKLLLDSRAVKSFMSGLATYLMDPLKLKRLLTPTVPASGATGPCMLDLMMGMKALQRPVIELLLDMMLDLCDRLPDAYPSSEPAPPSSAAHTPHSVPHRSQRAAKANGSSQNGPTPSSRSGWEGANGSLGHAMPASAAGHGLATPSSLQEAACSASSFPLAFDGCSSSSALQDPSMGLPELTAKQTSSSASSASSTLESSSTVEHPSTPAGHAAGLGSLPGVPRSHRRSRAAAQDTRSSVPVKAEDVLAATVAWLQSLPANLLEHEADGSSSPQEKGRPAQPRDDSQSPINKLSLILTDLPPRLQPDMMLVIPKLLRSAEQNAAAVKLLGALAEAQQESPQADSHLRASALGALSMLRMEPATADRSLRAALQVLPNLPDSELPPAVSLILRLAWDNTASRPLAIKAVRSRLNRTIAGAPPSGLEALRFAATQHRQLASVILADIESDCRRAAPAASARASSNNAAAPEPLPCLHVADLEVMVDLLGNPDTCPQAQSIFELALARKMISDMELAAVLERRRMQHLITTTLPASAVPGMHPHAAGTPLRSSPQQPGGSIPATPPFTDAFVLPKPLVSVDDFQSILGLAQTLARSRNAQVRRAAACLYSSMLRIYGDTSSRERMLSGLIQLAASPSGAQASHPGASGKATAAASHGGSAGAGSPGSSEMQPAAILLGLLDQYNGLQRMALDLSLRAVQSATHQAEAAQRRVDEASARQEKAAKATQAEADRRDKENVSLASQVAELQSRLDENQQEQQAELATLQSSKHDLEDKVKSRDGELEWMRAERRDEQSAWQRDLAKATGALREAEAMSSRAKAARRDEGRKLSKEKGLLQERLKAAEGAQRRAEEEAARFRALASGAAEQQQRAEGELESRSNQLRDTLQKREAELRQKGEALAAAEASLRGQQEYAAGLQDTVRLEQERIATFTGRNTDKCTTAELNVLACVHEDALTRVRSQLRQRQDSAAASVAAATSRSAASPAQLATSTSLQHRMRPLSPSLESLPSADPIGRTPSLPSYRSEGHPPMHPSTQPIGSMGPSPHQPNGRVGGPTHGRGGGGLQSHAQQSQGVPPTDKLAALRSSAAMSSMFSTPSSMSMNGHDIHGRRGSIGSFPPGPSTGLQNGLASPFVSGVNGMLNGPSVPPTVFSSGPSANGQHRLW